MMNVQHLLFIQAYFAWCSAWIIELINFSSANAPLWKHLSVGKFIMYFSIMLAIVKNCQLCYGWKLPFL